MSSEGDLHELIQSLIQSLQDREFCRYIYASAFAFLAWDYCLTLRQELKYIWRRQFNYLHALFVLNRYSPIIVVACDVLVINLPTSYITDTVCHVWLPVFYAVQIVQWFFASAIVVSRVLVLYQNDRPVRIILLCFCLIAMGAALGLATLNIIQMEFIAELPLTEERFCHSTKNGQLAYVPYLIILVFETAMLFLALWRLLCHRALTMSSQSWHSIDVFDVMKRESAVYFTVIFATSLVNLFLQPPFARETLHALWGPMNLAITSIACNRMVLHLKVESTRFSNVIYVEGDTT